MKEHKEPLRDKNGEIIRYESGRPVLLEHFENDFNYPREKVSALQSLKDHIAIGLGVPDSLYEEAGFVKKDGKWVKPDEATDDQDT